MHVDLHARLGQPNLPAVHRSLRGLELDAVRPRLLRERLAILQQQLDLLRLLPLLLDQHPVALVLLEHQPGRLAVNRRRVDRRVLQPQKHVLPPLRQHIDLQLRLDRHHIAADSRLAVDLGNQRRHRRLIIVDLFRRRLRPPSTAAGIRRTAQRRRGLPSRKSAAASCTGYRSSAREPASLPLRPPQPVLPPAGRAPGLGDWF